MTSPTPPAQPTPPVVTAKEEEMAVRADAEAVAETWLWAACGGFTGEQKESLTRLILGVRAAARAEGERTSTESVIRTIQEQLDAAFERGRAEGAAEERKKAIAYLSEASSGRGAESLRSFAMAIANGHHLEPRS